MEICIRVRLKPSYDRGEFELDRARSKNKIAENSVALGHETHNTCIYPYDFVKNYGLAIVKRSV